MAARRSRFDVVDCRLRDSLERIDLRHPRLFAAAAGVDIHVGQLAMNRDRSEDCCASESVGNNASNGSVSDMNVHAAGIAGCECVSFGSGKL